MHMGDKAHWMDSPGALSQHEPVGRIPRAALGGATCALMGELDQHDLIGDAAPGSIRSGLMSAVALPGTFWTNAVLHLRRASELAASAGSRND